MTKPLRILHFADLHIGMENYGRLDPETGLNRRVMDFLDRLDGVVDYALEHEADAVLFAGDAFRTRTPNPTYQREFARRLLRLSDAAIPTVLLVGNHDIPVMEQRASSVDIFDALAVPHITVARLPELLRLKTRRGILQVAAIPYPVRQRLLTREQFRRMRQEDLDRAVTEIVVGLIRQLAAQVDRELPAILMGHFSVESAHWGSERNIMVGRDVTVPLSALTDPVWDYVALGHIHQHQNLNLTSDPPVVYSGSLERVDFGEEKHPKGFCWVEIERGQATWHFIEVPARPFCTIRVDVRSEPEPLEAIQEAVARHDLTAAVVRLIVEMSPEQEPQLRDGMLSPLLTEAFFAWINREVERAARDRLEGLEPELLTPEHLLECYLSAKGKSELEIAAYQEEARTIFGED
ncbi:MAG: exonuclease SbcCD subunit D [Chloroflexota bacterium]|nr:exonuclease SbcCD subunit D [Chloroflexota bacterium]